MKRNKANCPNSIPINLLKLFKKQFSKPLSDIINLSYNQGVFPNLIKIANVNPIHKKGDKLDCNNNTPISVLFNLIKLLFSHQFSFHNEYSTNHALTSLTKMTRKALDEDKFACGVFIDLQKAFDTVYHGILLSQLNYYGVRGASYQWFI